MKKIILSLWAALALGITLHAQSTNAVPFVVTPSGTVTIQPAITVSILTVKSILLLPAQQTMIIYFVGVSQPYKITGAAFAQFQSTFQGQFGAAIAAAIQANPPQ